ncbi:MAG: GerAB/ArcD/ProY family transporter [Clostridia bacterium]|nr:GerAB/ArcD/ProY family transporter [Clostridia bacterium]
MSTTAQSQTVYKRQLGLLLPVAVPASKLLLLPSLITHYAERDAAITALIAFLVDFCMLLLIMTAHRLAPDKSVGELIEAALGKAGRAIVLCLVAVHFLLRTFAVLYEQLDMLNVTLYYKLPIVPTVFPFVAVLIYVVAKAPRILGRSGDLYFVPVLASFLLLLVLAIPHADFLNLLPVFYNGLTPAVKAIGSGLLWFGDFSFLMLFLGKIHPEKKGNGVLIAGALGSIFIAVLFFALFTAVYGNAAVRHLHAISKISKYASFLSNSGRFDWFAVFVLLIGVFFQMAICLYAFSESLRQAFALKSHTALAVIGGILLVIASIVTGRRFELFYRLAAQYLWPLFLFTQYLLPLCLPLIALVIRRKNHAHP